MAKASTPDWRIALLLPLEGEGAPALLDETAVVELGSSDVPLPVELAVSLVVLGVPATVLLRKSQYRLTLATAAVTLESPPQASTSNGLHCAHLVTGIVNVVIISSEIVLTGENLVAVDRCRHKAKDLNQPSSTS